MRDIQESLHDVYGVAQIIEETPEFLAERLAALDISLTATSDRSCYHKAWKLSPKYMDKFRLLALRAASFNVAEASNRLILFFEKKAELFGMETITRDIQLSDLNAADLEVLESGAFQLLPSKDRAGRAILSILPMMRNADCDVLNVVRSN